MIDPTRWSAIFLLGAAGLAAAQETCTPAEVRSEADGLRAPKVVWRETDWRPCLLEGLAAARAARKPVILWAFINGHPGDERC